MISDILFEALEEIERYQREMPWIYNGLTDKIEAVKVPMRRLMNELDTPPGKAPHKTAP